MPRHSKQVPSAWSNWELDKQYNSWKRYRSNAAGKYEIEYDPPLPRGQPSEQPRSVPLASIDEQPGTTQYPIPDNYTTAPDVPALEQDFSRVNLAPSPSANIYTAPVDATPPAELSSTHITTRDPQTTREEFDHHYKVHRAFEFRFGRVFKVLWSEPRGNDGSGNAGSQGTTVESNGNKQFSKVRRFVILSPREGHCICLPITTYSRQGVTKRGVHASHHTIIYSEREPYWFHGEYEKGMTKTPIKIRCDKRHKLDNASRLNYTKQYTVEYNVKVWFIGSVETESQWQLTADYNEANPPLQPKGVPPVPAQTFSYAQGGASLPGSESYPSTIESTSSQWTSSTNTPFPPQENQWNSEQSRLSRSVDGGGSSGGYSHASASYDSAEGASNYEAAQYSHYTNEQAAGSCPADDEDDDKNGDLYSAN